MFGSAPSNLAETEKQQCGSTGTDADSNNDARDSLKGPSSRRSSSCCTLTDILENAEVAILTNDVSEHCRHRLTWPTKHSATKALMSRLPDAISLIDALQTLLLCYGAPQRLGNSKRQIWIYRPTAETCLQTIRLLAGQLTVFIDASATAGVRDGSAGVIVTCVDPAYPTILHRCHLRGAAFAEGATDMQLAFEWTTAKHPTPLTHNLHWQANATQGNWASFPSDHHLI